MNAGFPPGFVRALTSGIDFGYLLSELQGDATAEVDTRRHLEDHADVLELDGLEHVELVLRRVVHRLLLLGGDRHLIHHLNGCSLVVEYHQGRRRQDVQLVLRSQRVQYGLNFVPA